MAKDRAALGLVAEQRQAGGVLSRSGRARRIAVAEGELGVAGRIAEQRAADIAANEAA